LMQLLDEKNDKCMSRLRVETLPVTLKEQYTAEIKHEVDFLRDTIRLESSIWSSKLRNQMLDMECALNEPAEQQHAIP